MHAAIALDYLLLVDKTDVVNSTAAETLARELYGLSRCFENCFGKDDWRQPKNSKNWVSKAQWGLRDRYSIRGLMAGKVRAPAADKEVQKEMETEALFSKYLDKSATGAGSESVALVETGGG